MHVHYVYPLRLSRSFSSPLSVHTSHVLQRFLVLPPVPVHFVPPLSLSNAHLLSLSLPNVCFFLLLLLLSLICTFAVQRKSTRLKWSFRVFFSFCISNTPPLSQYHCSPMYGAASISSHSQ